MAQHDRGGLLPASMMTLYGTWLLYAALSDNPSSCNRVDQHRKKNDVQIVLGFLISSLSITWASYSLFSDVSRTESSADSYNRADSVAKQPPPAANDDQHEDDEEDHQEAEPPLEDEQRKKFARFHAVMIAASMYMCMLLSNWGAPPSNNENQPGTVSSSNLWLNITSQWLSYILYTWTLVAPLLFPNRDWS